MKDNKQTQTVESPEATRSSKSTRTRSASHVDQIVRGTGKAIISMARKLLGIILQYLEREMAVRPTSPISSW